jgi:hypothetical protein
MVNFKEMLKISFEAILVNYCMITQRVQLYLEMTHPKLLKQYNYQEFLQKVLGQFKIDFSLISS